MEPDSNSFVRLGEYITPYPKMLHVDLFTVAAAGRINLNILTEFLRCPVFLFLPNRSRQAGSL